MPPSEQIHTHKTMHILWNEKQTKLCGSHLIVNDMFSSLYRVGCSLLWIFGKTILYVFVFSASLCLPTEPREADGLKRLPTEPREAGGLKRLPTKPGRQVASNAFPQNQGGRQMTDWFAMFWKSCFSLFSLSLFHSSFPGEDASSRWFTDMSAVYNICMSPPSRPQPLL